MSRIVFVSDLHGSTLCFRKFLTLLHRHNADAGIVAGDLSGKDVVRLVSEGDGTYRAIRGEGAVELAGESELTVFCERIAARGLYAYIEEADGDHSEAREFNFKDAEWLETVPILAADEKRTQRGDLIERLARARLRKWVQKASEFIVDNRIPIFMSGGNDDAFSIDEVIEDNPRVLHAESGIVSVAGHEMATISFSTPTPWNTHRELEEEELRALIRKKVARFNDVASAIVNIHVPPFDTALDQAPKLTDKLVPRLGQSDSVGSRAVREAIESYQPMLGLHGHVHESRAIQRFGRTLCVNPGSEYSQGVLRAVVLILADQQVGDFQFIAG